VYVVWRSYDNVYRLENNYLFTQSVVLTHQEAALPATETLYTCTHHKLCHKIYTIAKASDFNLVRSLGLPGPIINSHPQEKWV